ncbi:probable cytochrome P450 6a20 [Drosophila willistoni]|uniref:probable cytochrome P450 6a20 n=1 Tax=Drosophila willistoni TaxID=7260 RepID=UPI00017D6D6A|nr:probable cytochrome P450 6a20 [Drosophila willistoni]
MSTIIVLFAGVLTLIAWWFRQRFSYWQRRGISHDTPRLLIGNMHEWKKTKQISYIMKATYDKFKGSGPFAGFYFFMAPAVVALELDFIKEVLIKQFDKFHDRGVFHNERDDPLSASLITIEGQKWRQLRQKLTPTFTSGKMKFMYPTVEKVAKELLQAFDQQLENSSLLEVHDLAARYTADVIGSCAFGLECNSLSNPQAEFVIMGGKAIKERHHGNFINSMIFSFPNLAKALRMRINLYSVEDFYTNIVRETVDYRIKNGVKRNDFMDSLIDLIRKHEEGSKTEGLTFNEVVAQAAIFFLAGFETSSTTMGFALYELALNQDIQDKLRKEISSVLAKYNNEFTYECMMDQRYLSQVVDETLRKYPVAAHLFRRTNQRYVNNDSKYYIEPGTLVFIPTLALHYDPEYYEEPEKFKPERFSDDAIQQRPSCAYLPFGEGPRNCIGMRFGKMQTVIGLAKLISIYKFEVHPEKTQLPLELDTTNFLLSAKGGIHLNVSKVV